MFWGFIMRRNNFFSFSLPAGNAIRLASQKIGSALAAYMNTTASGRVLYGPFVQEKQGESVAMVSSKNLPIYDQQLFEELLERNPGAIQFTKNAPDVHCFSANVVTVDPPPNETRVNANDPEIKQLIEDILRPSQPGMKTKP